MGVFASPVIYSSDIIFGLDYQQHWDSCPGGYQIYIFVCNKASGPYPLIFYSATKSDGRGDQLGD